MATKQKYLSAKWKLGTKSGIHYGITGHIFIDITIDNNGQNLQLVCCVVKKIQAFIKVSMVINIKENSLLFHCRFKRG